MNVQRTEMFFPARLVWLCLVCGILACVPGCTASMQDSMTFRRLSKPSTVVSKFEGSAVRYRIDLEAKNGKRGADIEAWFIPAAGATAAHPAPVAVVCHGNLQSIADMDDYVEGYKAMGWSVLLPEYRGYGHAAGEPSQEAIGSDAVKFYDMMAARPDVDRNRIVFHGHSLGGAVAAELATRRKPAALILASSFTRTAYFPLSYGMPSMLEGEVRNPFHTDEVVARLDRPILIFHGRHDDTIAVTEGQKLHAIAKGSIYVEYDCTHILPDEKTREDYWAQVRKFLESNGIVKGP